MSARRTYAIEFLRSAERELASLPRHAQRRVSGTIAHLAEDPRPDGAKLLSGTGRERIWRIDVGDYRVLYQVEDERLIVLVVRVADRREAYRPTEMKRLLKRLRS
jgi:mRNA interferase RelE/StbE